MTKLTGQIIQVDEVISGSPVFLEEALKRMESLKEKKTKQEEDLWYRYNHCDCPSESIIGWNTVDSLPLKTKHQRSSDK